MAFARRLPIDLVGCSWDAEGLEQPVSVTLGLPLGVPRRSWHLSGLLAFSDHERVEVSGELRLRTSARQPWLSIHVVGVDSTGRCVALTVESRALVSLRSLSGLWTLGGTLTRAGAEPEVVWLGHDTRRAVLLRKIWASGYPE